MQSYELALVISPKLTESKLKEAISQVEKLVVGEKGKVEKQDLWKKRNLAYPINQEKEAQYAFLQIKAPCLSAGFSQRLRLIKGVMRFLLLNK